MAKCAGKTKEGKRCKKDAVKGSKFCSVHKGKSPTRRRPRKSNKPASVRAPAFKNSSLARKYSMPAQKLTRADYPFEETITDDDKLQIFPNPPAP